MVVLTPRDELAHERRVGSVGRQLQLLQLHIAHTCPYDYCWRSWGIGVQMPQSPDASDMIVGLTEPPLRRVVLVGQARHVVGECAVHSGLGDRPHHRRDVVAGCVHIPMIPEVLVACQSQRHRRANVQSWT